LDIRSHVLSAEELATTMNDLKQCPYNKATKCSMSEPCEGCETKAIHDTEMEEEENDG